ncbi:MAG TPA: phosphodiester glycosidase family protein, partial [Nocardioidaceae bacterium]|nr:phosphodiester glycosidase family protein [Nocardioidaceae bacterium]
VTVTNLNAPQLHAHGIGIYTAAWGGAARSRVLPTADRRREVVVRRGRVRANRKRLSSGPIPAGTLHLVGTGEGARRLARLKKGTRVRVEYGLNRAATRVAVGGNVVLLRGGEVLAPGDAEMHPRTAIGIDTDLNRVIIVAVDGRRSHSRGLTMKETGFLLKQLGAEEGLNLDGGGSSTMMARESGEAIAVVNTPSDGRLRRVPNGLGFAFAKGSGKLRGIRVEPATDTEDSRRVLRGLSRVLVARGHDETHDPVQARPTWRAVSRVSVRNGPAPRTVVVGRRTGTGIVAARGGGAVGRFRLQVLGRVQRLEPSVSSIVFSGKGGRGSVALRGYDAQGFGTWVEPRDVRLTYNRKKFAVRRTGRGFTVFARVPSASGVVKLTAGGRSTHVGLAVGLARSLVDRMNSLDGWRASASPAKANASLSMTKNRRGRARSAIALRYSLFGRKATRASYLDPVPPKGLPMRAQKIGLWVRGDGKGAALRLTARDAAGKRSVLSLARRVSWQGWRFVSASLPTSLEQPLKVVRVQVVETRRARRYRGTLVFDDLTVFTKRVPRAPATAPLRDPLVADLAPTTAGGLRVAVLSDAAISASSPNGIAVERTRRTMRQIVAAKPDLVLINGDLVARGTSANFALARRVIAEELGDKVAWRYIPGDRERGTDGQLTAFRAEFGAPVRAFDQAGTRFVLLNSAQGAFRLGGFGQLVRLRSELASSAADPSVESVVVVAHHPSDALMPGGTAELTDPREGELVEELLSDFRAGSQKRAVYVGSHARQFGLTRRDGVAHVFAGPVSNAARARIGSFTGWSLLSMEDTDSPWLQAAFLPHVNRLRVTAPDSLAVGAGASAVAWVNQAGRRIRVDYPMNAVWEETAAVHIGPASGAPSTAVVAYEPGSGRLTALKRGVARLEVLVNGASASHTVTVR